MSPPIPGKTSDAPAFARHPSAEDVCAGLSLSGRTILVTGGTSGLGAETCRVLALHGAHVLATGRTLAAAERACAQLPGRASAYACELAAPDSVRACVARIREEGHRIDAIVGNAGIMALPTLQLACGYELQFFTNHVGHFILVTGLLDRLREDGRVVMLSSLAHRQAPRCGIDFDDLRGERGYHPWRSYGQSKLANLLFAVELQRRFAGSQRTAYAVHPGVAGTRLARHMGKPTQAFLRWFGSFFLKDVAHAAATTVFAAVHPLAPAFAGEYLADCRVARASAQARDAALARRLWQVSEEIVAGLPERAR